MTAIPIVLVAMIMVHARASCCVQPTLASVSRCMADEASWIEPKRLTLLTGDERFQGMDATVREFWAWSTSDLRDDTTRGILAEFIVGQALGAQTKYRISWSNFDLETPSGVRVEVKSSAYLQSWAQKKLSQIRFTGLTARSWDEKTGFSEEPEVRADVFVFAIQTCMDPQKYDALDIGQWEFYVDSGEAIRKRGSRSVVLPTVRRDAKGPFTYSELARAVRAAAPRD
jgi:hypothetical protein